MSDSTEHGGNAPSGAEAVAALCFSGLADQFDRSWWMLRDAVTRFTEEEWYSEIVPGMAPARRAFHLVYWSDVYVRRSRTAVTGVPDPDTADLRSLPGQAALLGYMDQVADRIDSVLRKGRASQLLRDFGTRRTGANLHERLIYVLRHNLQHYGELQAMLRLAGHEPGEWR